MMSNLYGDFVKGRDYSYLPEIVQKGVLLHRQIDDYIDHHEDVKELRLKLFHNLPKVAGIAIDLYMDHCLARSWNEYHDTPLSDYLASFFKYSLNPIHQKFNNPNFKYSDEFIKLLTIIHQQKWIENYRYSKGLSFASNGLSNRISFPNNLHEAPYVYKKHKHLIDTTFSLFMRDAIQRFNIH